MSRFKLRGDPSVCWRHVHRIGKYEIPPSVPAHGVPHVLQPQTVENCKIGTSITSYLRGLPLELEYHNLPTHGASRRHRPTKTHQKRRPRTFALQLERTLVDLRQPCRSRHLRHLPSPMYKAEDCPFAHSHDFPIRKCSYYDLLCEQERFASLAFRPKVLPVVWLCDLPRRRRRLCIE